MKTRIILLLFVLLESFNFLNAQTYDFEESCSQSSYAFWLGCIGDWINTHGTADNNGANGPAYSGSRYAHFYTRINGCSNNNVRQGEGIALNYNFEKGITYKIKYAIRVAGVNQLLGSQNLEMDLILTSGLVNTNPLPTNNCASYNAVPSIPSFSQAITGTQTFTNNIPNWQIQEFCFTANDNYSQFWFRSIITGFTGQNVTTNTYIDAFNIEKLSSPIKITDENGIPKSEFCMGEDVWLMVDPNLPNPVYVDTWLDPNYVNDWYTGPGWVNHNNGMINLSEELRNNGDRNFEPTNTFFIKFAYNHPICGWTESKTKFIYKCCEGVDYSSFSANISNSSAPFYINADADVDYTDFGGIHEFCIFTDVDQDGNYEYVGCWESPNIEYLATLENTEYYIVHRVITPCGVYCSSVSVCAGCGSNFNQSSSSDLCDEIFNCGSVGGLGCPTAISTPGQGTGYNLTWNSTINVSKYIIEFTGNDPKCGCRNDENTRKFVSNYFSNTNSLFLTNFRLVPNCFSYRVRTVCSNGAIGPWSERKCYPSCLQTPGIARSYSDELNGNNVSIFPNPTNENISIEFTNYISGDENTVSIYNLDGKLETKRLVVNTKELTLNLSDLNPGPYILNTVSSRGEINNQMFIKL